VRHISFINCTHHIRLNTFQAYYNVVEACFKALLRIGHVLNVLGSSSLPCYASQHMSSSLTWDVYYVTVLYGKRILRNFNWVWRIHSRIASILTGSCGYRVRYFCCLHRCCDCDVRLLHLYSGHLYTQTPPIPWHQNGGKCNFIIVTGSIKKIS